MLFECNGFFSLSLFLCSLPLVFRCVAPGPAFLQLSAGQSEIVLYNLTTLCTDLDPQVMKTQKHTFIFQLMRAFFRKQTDLPEGKTLKMNEGK